MERTKKRMTIVKNHYKHNEREGERERTIQGTTNIFLLLSKARVRHYSLLFFFERTILQPKIDITKM